MAMLSEQEEPVALLERQLAPIVPVERNNAVKVLHVINGEHYAGAERVQDLLALNLNPFGYEAGFACLKAGRFASLRQAYKAPLYDLSMKSRFDVRPAKRLAKIVRDEHFALIHTHTPRAAMIGRLAALLAGVPMVHHVHSPTTKDSTRGLRDRVNAAIERASLTGVSGIIAVSHSLGQYAISQGLPQDKLRVVPNGVPARGPLSERKPPDGQWTLGTVALFRPRKGLEVLLEAIALLRVQGLSPKLRIVGDFETPEYRATILSLVAHLNIHDAIEWVGFTQNVPNELAKMDVFVLPSLFGEGLPMVILEAMAAGVPIVGTRVEGVPEAVRDGQEGLIASPNDPADLARVIARYIRGQADWSALRASAHQRQAELFSDRSMAQGVAELYQQVLS